MKGMLRAKYNKKVSSCQVHGIDSMELTIRGMSKVLKKAQDSII